MTPTDNRRPRSRSGAPDNVAAAPVAFAAALAFALAFAAALALAAPQAMAGRTGPDAWKWTECPPAEDADVRTRIDCGRQAEADGLAREAERLFRQAVEQAEATLPPGHRDHGSAVRNLAIVVGSLRGPDGAVEVYRAALERLDRRVDAGDPARVGLLQQLALALGRLRTGGDAAIRAAQEAVDVASGSAAEEPGASRLLHATLTLAGIQERAGRPEAAAATLRGLVDRCGWDPAQDRSCGNVLRLAALEEQLGRPDAADRAYALGLEILMLRVAPDNPSAVKAFDAWSALGERHGRDDIVERAEAFREAALREELLAREPVPAGRIYRPSEPGVRPAQRVRSVQPRYPEAGRAAREEARLLVRAVVLPNGRLTDIEIECDNPGFGFEEAAREALREWIFEPATVDRKPVSMRWVSPIGFSLH